MSVLHIGLETQVWFLCGVYNFSLLLPWLAVVRPAADPSQSQGTSIDIQSIDLYLGMPDA